MCYVRTSMHTTLTNNNSVVVVVLDYMHSFDCLVATHFVKLAHQPNMGGRHNHLPISADEPDEKLLISAALAPSISNAAG
jgi:hypothetical protein